MSLFVVFISPVINDTKKKNKNERKKNSENRMHSTRRSSGKKDEKKKCVAAAKYTQSVRKIIIFSNANEKNFHFCSRTRDKKKLLNTKVPQLKWKRQKNKILLEIVLHTCLDSSRLKWSEWQKKKKEIRKRRDKKWRQQQ